MDRGEREARIVITEERIICKRERAMGIGLEGTEVVLHTVREGDDHVHHHCADVDRVLLLLLLLLQFAQM